MKMGQHDGSRNSCPKQRMHGLMFHVDWYVPVQASTEMQTIQFLVVHMWYKTYHLVQVRYGPGPRKPGSHYF